tara:strand:- start:1116 stop:2261 length:1146 start_codon:yes stop_codon:yes gene_type:complete
MKIAILGADGYLGWPTAVNLAFKKNKLLLIDNYVKRRLMTNFNKKPLVLSPKLDKKVKYLKSHGCQVNYENIDCCNYDKLYNSLKKFKPDAVIHYAELPSAPYSMIGEKEAWLTLQNNLRSTFNLVWCVKAINKNCHIIKLGTMGEYGTPNIDIEEGWINVKHNNRNQKFMYPRQASSLYHTSKIMDTDLLWFYVRMYDLRVTDLMQGPVYGVLDNEFMSNNNLQNTYSYDDIFGTVLNRFIVQAVAGMPLTIYGSGNQIRGYINIKDSLKCIDLALNNPPKAGKLNINNQFTEQFSVNQLAKKVKSALKEINISAEIKKIINPRKEKEKHYYNAKNTNLLKLGLKPRLLTNKEIIKLANYVIGYKKKINKNIIKPKTKWV